MTDVGLDVSDDFESNLKLMNQYTDAVYDFIAPNKSIHKTIAIFNNNIEKHLTDMPFDTKWNLLAYHFNSQEGLDQLKHIINDTSKGEIIRTSDGKSFADHLSYHAERNTLMFDNPTDKGSINVLDKLINKIRLYDDEYSKAFTEQLDIFEQSNGRLAMQSIQRQFMNTFEAEKFRMDARVYQALQMQSDLYTSGNGAKLAERIRTDISSGEYDRNIVSIFHNSEIDNVWANSVRNRRGLLRPKKEQDMYLGILDSLNFLNGKTELANTNKYNIISLNANEIISNIPSSGANSEAYQDFIFKINGEYSDFIKTRAKLGSNNFNIKAASNEFLLDISDIGYVEYNKKKITQLMLPFQQIAVADENVFASDEATKKTVSFFNALKQHSEVNDEGTQRKLQQAFDDLMDAYKRELDTRNKDSLISKSIFRMDMPNSAGVLAKDAIVPTVDISSDLLQEITDLQNKLIRASESGTKISSNDINALQAKFIDRESATREQISKLIASRDAGNIDMSLLKLTGDLNNKYSKYMISADGKTIESAILVGKGTFKRTQMDTGRIGMQIFFDYYNKTPGLTKYDDYSRISKGKFRLFDEGTEEIDQIRQFYKNLFTSFDETNHSEWAAKTKDAIDVIFNSTEMTDVEKMSKASKKFGLRLNDYIKELDVYAPKEYGESYRKALVEEYKTQFLEEVNSRFEVFGDKYAREVGILGLTNRYPNFNEKGVLPVRIYLDNTIKGNTARFLGPQFSLWQNLDFDGDNEFIKFLGNGGLYSKNAAESVLMNKQFKYMNEKNFNEFIKTLADQESLKAYRIGDETAFKAQLLKELNSDAYSRAKQSFISSLDKDSRRAFDEAHESIQDLLINHSVQIKKEFQAFDEAMGSSITNPEMIKAAMQARIAKEYIGNFSKPNLDIRDAMTYMLNHAVINDNVEEETALLNIKKNLFDMLSELEQKGIDTKHVHDATYLDSSSSWRLGVRKLFENANGAKQQSESEINKSIELLVKGSKKVYFKQANGENANEFIQQMVSNIKSKTIADFTKEIKQIQGEVPDELFGQLYIRSLYEMSQRENAYDAFFGTFKNFASRDIANTLNSLELDDFEKVRQIVINNKDASGKSFDDLAKIIIARSMESSRTDELLNVNGRAIREGDLLAYDTSNGPALYKFTGMDTDIKSGKFVANFEEYDLDDVNKAVTKKRQFDGVTIREINENIKNSRYYEGAKAGNINHIIDLKNASRDHLNFNVRDLDNPETNEIFLRKELSRLSVENRLQVLTNTRGESDFKDTFEFLVKKEIPNISEEYSAESITGTIADIVGTDYSAFKKRSDIIEQYLDYGIETGAITGSKDAKELMRRINSEIANNPRSSINLSRYSGNIDSVNSILTNYLDGIEDVKIIDPGFLNVDIDNIRLSNEISNEINIAIANRESSLNKYAEDFYRTYISNPGEDIIDDAFNIASKNAKETYAQTNELIFKSLSKSSDPEAEMFRVFNWDRVNDKIDLSKAKVGYGRYTGVQFIDLTQSQRTEILDQINNLDNILAKDSLEYKAAINTRDLLNQFRGFSADSDLIDFSSKDLLAKSSRLKFEDLIEEQKKTINEAMNNARAEARSMNKKTLLSGLKESIQDIGITKSTLKKGGLILGGVTLAGIAGHALFNKDSSDSNVEVPKSMQGMTSGAKPMHIQNKNDLGYSDNERVAKENKPKRQIAPPSIKKNRTIYHDNASGFDFKVSAQSYNKLQEESYYKMAARAGAANTTLNVNKDNSRITDNWLENKFADLTE
jgi:predicted HicB family RNase H-like nuclease